MDAPRVLVVYYSRTGHTRAVARMLAHEFDCASEALVDTCARTGLPGAVRCGIDAALAHTTTLKQIEHDPADYDLVLIGTPVFCRSLSAPVRAYLQSQHGRFRSTAFFLTHGGIGRERVFEQMTELTLREPLARLSMTEYEIEQRSFLPKAEQFVARLRRALESETVSARFSEPPMYEHALPAALSTRKAGSVARWIS